MFLCLYIWIPPAPKGLKGVLVLHLHLHIFRIREVRARDPARRQHYVLCFFIYKQHQILLAAFNTQMSLNILHISIFEISKISKISKHWRSILYNIKIGNRMFSIHLQHFPLPPCCLWYLILLSCLHLVSTICLEIWKITRWYWERTYHFLMHSLFSASEILILKL